MENAPLTPDHDSGKTDSGKKKKKRAEALGIFAIDSGPASKQEESAESILDKLTLTKRKRGESEATISLSEVHEAELLQTLEVDEEHIDKLTPGEEQFVVRQLVVAEAGPDTARPNSEAERTAGEATEDVVTTAEEAVAQFRQELLAGKPLEEAFRDGIARLEAIETTETPHPKATGTDKTAEKFTYEPEEVFADNALTEPAEPIVSERSVPPESILTEHTQEQEQPAAGSSTPTDSSSGGGMPPGGSHIIGGNIYPTPPAAGPAPPRVEKEYVPYYNGGDVMSAALIGGIIGYLIGRRRGRIKTERKLKPVQKKLEKQVRGLQEDIRSKELYIRKVAGERLRDRGKIFQMEELRKKSDQKMERLENGRPAKHEAEQPASKKVVPEQIGHVLVTRPEATSKAEKRPERRREKIVPLKTIDKQVATMGRAELLDLSDKVAVENTTLRRVYETHLVSEQGLRRLVNEYVKGGDVGRALRRELVEHEIDFERDPILRDRVRPIEDGVKARGDTLNQLLQKADLLSESQAKDELAVLKARQEHHEAQRQRQQKSRRLLDISMVAAITILFVLVVMLLLKG